MKIANWSHSSEIKELMCGNKIIVTQCSTMQECPALACPMQGCIDYCSSYWVDEPS